MNVDLKNTEAPQGGSWGLRLKRWLLRDIARKIVALALAALLYWLCDKKNEVSETHSNVPVKVDLPAGLVCLSDAGSLRASLTITGDKKLLEAFDPSRLHVQAAVDARNFVAGNPYTLRIRPENIIGLERRLTVSAISPRDFKLNLESVETKQVPVLARFDSERNLAQEYQISKVSFVPSAVTVSGPKNVLSSMNEIYTLPIPIDNKITESFDYRIGLRVPEGVLVDRAQVDAQVEIERALVERTFTSVPLLTVQSAEHTRKFKVRRILPESVTVTLRGPKEIMVKLPSEEITAILNINSVKKAGTFELAVNPMLETPRSGVTVKRIQPAVAEVTVDCE